MNPANFLRAAIHDERAAIARAKALHHIFLLVEINAELDDAVVLHLLGKRVDDRRLCFAGASPMRIDIDEDGFPCGLRRAECLLAPGLCRGLINCSLDGEQHCGTKDQ